MERTSVFAIVAILMSLLSLNAAEKCPSVDVKPPGECDCGHRNESKTMYCIHLVEAPVIPYYINEVRFRDSSLSTIPSYIFKKATNLQSLIIVMCRTVSIDVSAFVNLTKLTGIFLANNALRSAKVISNILQSCPQLQKLIVINSIAGYVETLTIPKHDKLTSLDLSNNLITATMDFRNLSQLESLSLDNIIPSISLSRLHISGMHHLTSISMQNALVDQCYRNDSRKILADLPNLQDLHLDAFFNDFFNDNSYCLPALLTGLSKLKTLTLTRNILENLPSHTFKDLSKLQYLLLGDNLLASLPAQLFHPLKDIIMIDLTYNKLTYLYPEHFQNLNKLKTVQLFGNEFSCTCEIRPFVAWINNNKIHVYKVDKVICAAPRKYTNTPLLNFNPPWISCDNHGWLLAGLSGTLLLIILLIFLTVYYFRWDIRFWLAVRRTHKRLRREAQANERTRLIQDDNEADERTCLIQDREDYHAFASYCSRDSEWVKRELVVNLEEADDIQFRLCIDERDFTPGMTVVNNISLKMSQSKKIIFVVSRSFIQSRWCTFEVDLAQTKILDENSGMIIIIFLENIPKRDMPRSLCRLCKHVTHITWDASPRKKVIFWKRLKLAMNA